MCDRIRLDKNQRPKTLLSRRITSWATFRTLDNIYQNLRQISKSSLRAFNIFCRILPIFYQLIQFIITLPRPNSKQFKFHEIRRKFLKKWFYGLMSHLSVATYRDKVIGFTNLYPKTSWSLKLVLRFKSHWNQFDFKARGSLRTKYYKLIYSISKQTKYH